MLFDFTRAATQAANDSPTKPTDQITILTAVDGALATKRHVMTPQGVQTQQYGKGYRFEIRQEAVEGINDVWRVVQQLQAHPASFVVRGEPRDGVDWSCARRLLYADPKNGDPATFDATSRSWFMVDIDGVECPAGVDPVEDPEDAVEHLIGLLPPELWDATCVWQWSSSQGVKAGGALSCHLFFWSAEPLTDDQLTRWAGEVNASGKIIDAAVYRAVQPHYVAAPLFEGMRDPLPRRIGLRRGLEDVVTLEVPEAAPLLVRDYSGAAPSVGPGFEGKLSAIGGPEGFRRPIVAAASYFIAGRVDPDTGYLKARLRDAILRADPGGRSPAEIERYASDRHLDEIIAWAERRERVRSGGGGFAFDLSAAAPQTDQPATEAAKPQEVTMPTIVNFADYQPSRWDGERFVAEAPEPAAADYDLAAFAVSKMQGRAPERQYLVKDIFPLAVPVIVAGQGGVGKSYMLADAALKIAEWDGRGAPPRAFGGDLAAHGRVVVISAEDDWDELHRRIDELDPTGERRERAGDRLMLVPFSAIGGAALIKETSMGLEITEAFHTLRDKLRAIPDLRLVVLDPLSVFFHINQNDTSQAYTTMSTLGALSSELGATVAAVHHFSKLKEGIKDVEEARGSVKGNAALVDGSRASYALWKTPEEEGKRLAAAFGVEYHRSMFVSGGVVKANYKHDSGMHTYMRQGDSPVLVDITAQARTAVAVKVDDDLEELAVALEERAEMGRPLSASGRNGLYEARLELPAPWNKASRRSLESGVLTLLAAGRIVKVPDQSRAGHPTVLDGPNGQYAVDAR